MRTALTIEQGRPASVLDHRSHGAGQGPEGSTAFSLPRMKLVARPGSAAPQRARFGCGLGQQAQAPLFEVEGNGRISEVVVVCYRDADGRPVHGGLYAYRADGTVATLELVDRHINFSTRDVEPADLAVGFLLSFPNAVQVVDFRRYVRNVQWSILDYGSGDRGGYDIPEPTAARLAVKRVFDLALMATQRDCERVAQLLSRKVGR